ncbi:MAG: hypothetical protein M1821_005083 [Bathelium mastoideum]|nr:MAG: hypothetical protein M1821_005083 [Bathelium mastoideum]
MANSWVHAIWDQQNFCIDFFVDVPVDTVTYNPLFAPFQNQNEATEFLLRFTRRDAPPATSMFGSPKNISTTFNISTRYCSPAEQSYGKSIDTVLLLTHGLGFDKSYWSFNFPKDDRRNYSFTAHATLAGFATLSYDRLGYGLSQHEDPYNIIQAQVELAILTSLTKLLREGKLHSGIPIPKKVAHVGHSFGSLLSNGIAVSAPELTDAVVLTGFSHLTQYLQWYVHSTAYHLARLNQPKRFGNFESGWVTWGDQFYNQFNFFTWPFFDPKLLEYAEDNKWPFTVGEFMTSGFVPVVAPEFTKPVLLMTAEFDLIFCGANCTDIVTAPAEQAFPKAELEVYMQPNTGHGMNLHFNATGWYEVVFDWLCVHGF